MLAALTEWGVAYPGLNVMVERDEILERGLKPIAAEPEQVTGATLHEASLSQIALLEPELINYCRQTPERAQALFGLVVCYVASADDSWRTTAEMAVKTKEGEKTVALSFADCYRVLTFQSEKRCHSFKTRRGATSPSGTWRLCGTPFGLIYGKPEWTLTNGSRVRL
ncbi:hypothetical protein [Bradyrhizobium sp. Ec3.3]|uniref:hypothetical protein n=1 Tax=Bradyrhizobium sp. Ec3.3 TaxID=189753 RepID=UPI00041C150E|nr:hypothetical protein [Bradyrhizobium sp. Ec3.3]